MLKYALFETRIGNWLLFLFEQITGFILIPTKKGFCISDLVWTQEQTVNLKR